MAATLTLDTITSSGSTITVPTGKTLAITDDGALTIGTPPVAITTGATQVTGTAATAITMATTGSPTINITGKSASIVSVDASGGTSVTHTVTLPTPATFSTTSISVMSRVAHGAGNKIVINNSGGTEVYTLYKKGDHCELVSDGTNTIRTGNEWVTVSGEVALTGHASIATGTVTDIWNSTAYVVVSDLGSVWDATDDDFTAPFDGTFRFRGTVASSAYPTGWHFQKNGTWINQGYNSGAYGDYPVGDLALVLDKNDVITAWLLNTAGTASVRGDATASNPRTILSWWTHRRS